MAGHTRLYRRGAVYYHRAAVPSDIKSTYPKTEEVVSLKTSDHKEALRLVRIEAVKADKRFEDHRRSLGLSSGPQLSDLTDAQMNYIAKAYHAHLLEEDDETRIAGFYEGATIPVPSDTFEEHEETNENFSERYRKLHSRGKVDDFFIDEVAEVLAWEGIELPLDRASPSWLILARKLQAEATGDFVYVTSREGSGVFNCDDGRSGPFSFVSTGSRGNGHGSLGNQAMTFTFGK